MADSAYHNQLILAVAKNKDKGAFGRLYDECAPLAYGLAVRILKNEAEAEDVLQQAFLSLWENAADFDAKKAKVTTWLGAFVRNKCIDLIRRKKTRRSVSLDGSDGDDESGAISVYIQDGSRPIEDDIAHRAQCERVSLALKRLPEPQRVLIEAAYYEGLTQQEMADRFKEPLGTIKTRMRLGMMKLAGLLKEEANVL